ncbi:MAG TPA: MarR family transcriptional regulator [Gammaproteobacteria bacterium]
MKTRPATPDSRRLIMQFIKRQGEATAGEVAEHLGVTREGARQQLQLLEAEGWIARCGHQAAEGAGRPAVSFQITPAGDHMFPKNYDALSMTLVDAVADQLGQEALVKLLASITEQQVRLWEPRLAGKTLPERIKALKGIYFEEDPHTSVRKDARGYTLVERNCPFLNVAMRRPQLCSITLNTLTRLLGVRVVRDERFQDGDRRCVFRVLEDQPVAAGHPFTLEEPAARAA